MFDLTAFLSTVITLFLAELGDKTQVAAVALFSLGRSYRRLLGCILGFILVNVAVVVLGGLISSLVSYTVVRFASATVFLIFGILSLRVGGGEEAPAEKTGFLGSTALIGLMEAGDKTNLATLALTLRFEGFIEVLLGLIVASILLMGVAFAVGSTVTRFTSLYKVRLASAFIFIGVAFYMFFELALEVLA